MRITNGRKYENGTFVENDSLCVSGQRISENSMDHEVLDATDCYVIPGLIDLHFHGCNGVDFCDGTIEAMEKMASYELMHGITTIHPATMTLSEEELLAISKTAKEFHRRQEEEPVRYSTEAEFAGIYMEGPFISLEKKGAQNPKFVQKPDLAMLQRLQEASGGLYRISVVAPEVEGALSYIPEAAKQMRISVAHTTADYDTAREAFRRGAKQVTHLYNAMPPFSHRAPGVIGAASDTEDVMVEMICDGVHLHPSTIRTSFRMFGADRIIYISDSMMATGMPEGIYALGGQEVEVRGNLAVLTGDGAIAGSATNLFDCMKFSVKKAGIPLEQAVRCATENPAKAIGVYESQGSLSIGKYADILILNSDLDLKHVVHRGTVVF